MVKRDYAASTAVPWLCSSMSYPICCLVLTHYFPLATFVSAFWIFFLFFLWLSNDFFLLLQALVEVRLMNFNVFSDPPLNDQAVINPECTINFSLLTKVCVRSEKRLVINLPLLVNRINQHIVYIGAFWNKKALKVWRITCSYYLSNEKYCWQYCCQRAVMWSKFFFWNYDADFFYCISGWLSI